MVKAKNLKTSEIIFDTFIIDATRLAREYRDHYGDGHALLKLLKLIDKLYSTMGSDKSVAYFLFDDVNDPIQQFFEIILRCRSSQYRLMTVRAGADYVGPLFRTLSENVLMVSSNPEWYSHLYLYKSAHILYDGGAGSCYPIRIGDFYEIFHFLPTAESLPLYIALKGDKLAGRPAGLIVRPEALTEIMSLCRSVEQFVALLETPQWDDMRPLRDRIVSLATPLPPPFRQSLSTVIEPCQRNVTEARIMFRSVSMPFEPWMDEENPESLNNFFSKKA